MMPPGNVLDGKYVLHDCIGHGGMGDVFLASEPELARDVAIKILHPDLARDRQSVAQFRDEAVAASRVHHPGVVTIFDARTTGATPYIVMELLRGRPLGRLIAEQRVPVRRAATLAIAILDTLEAVHGAGVVHNDITSDNFIVEPLADGDNVKLIDFGLARIPHERAPAATHTICGTPEYMAPEVIAGGAGTPASDLYAAGVILYELLTGSTPFGGGSPNAIMRRHVEDLVVAPSLRCPERDIPRALDDVAVCALEKDPAARFPDAAAFAAALRPIVARTHVLAHETPPPVLARRPRASIDPLFAHLRRDIARGIERGDRAQIVDGYTRLANTLAHMGHYTEAIAELEEGIAVVGETGADALAVVLAELYKETGRPRRASTVAASADHHPTLEATRP